MATVASRARPFIQRMVPLLSSRVEGDTRRRRSRVHRGLPQSWTVASTDSAPPAACHNRAVTAVLIRRGNLARLAAGPVALAVGLGALAVAQGPGRFTTYAGRSGLTATLIVAAGLALVVAGLVTSFSRPAGRIGDLAVLAGLVWFAPVWDCWANCSDNLFLLRSLPRLARGIETTDRWLIAAAAAALVTLCAGRLLQDSGPARRTLLPVATPAILLAGAVMAHAIALQRMPQEDPSDPAFRTIFALGC